MSDAFHAANGSPAHDGAPDEASRRPAALSLVPVADQKLTTKDFKSDQEVRWCPGCGDYAIHSIHGRAPAIATGLAASRPDLSVWVITGDGDALSIGGNHLIHALRRNVNIKILLFNNRIYGLTKGQYSPTSEQGKVTKSTPFGSLDTPFNPVSLALGAEASFVARTIDSDRKHLQSVLRAAADHRGSAFIEIFQNCPIFNDDAFAPIKEPNSRDDQRMSLQDGEPIRFGAGGQRGLRVGRYGSLEAVEA